MLNDEATWMEAASRNVKSRGLTAVRPIICPIPHLIFTRKGWIVNATNRDRKNKMKRYGNYLGLVMVLAFSFMFALGLFPITLAHAQEITIVSVSAPSQIETGERFTINILVEPGAEIAGAQFELAFDPSLVTVDSVKEGQLFSQSGAATYFSPGIMDNVTGVITGIAGVVTTPGQTVSGTGIFAIITLTAGKAGGTCSFTLSDVLVADINGISVPTSVLNGQVRIGANRTPVLDPIGDKKVNKGELLTFIISATDVDGDSLTYTASNLPRGANFDPSTQTFSWTPRGNQLGTYANIQFEVSDSSLTDSESITIAVDDIEKASKNQGKRGGPKK
jgi:hypothetical protein